MINIRGQAMLFPELMEYVIEGMRNPLNSWDKSDSFKLTCEEVVDGDDVYMTFENSGIGEEDLKLTKKLIKAGSDERKFMRMIPVYATITAPMYWWKEFDTYKIGTVRNSCSTMHKLPDKEFSLDDFSHDRLLVIEKLETVISWLNEYRELYINWDDKRTYVDSNGVPLERKDIWWQMIQLLPSSYNQKATVMLNYEVLRNMYHARKTHKLDEWREFCKWVETLPYAKELICE